MAMDVAMRHERSRVWNPVDVSHYGEHYDIRSELPDGEKCSRFQDLRQVLPSLSIGQLKTLLKELKEEDRIYSKGKTKAGLWHLVSKHDQLDKG
jgi:hypothetical protein